MILATAAWQDQKNTPICEAGLLLSFGSTGLGRRLATEAKRTSFAMTQMKRL
jgi:hypothetical protein